MSTLRTNNVSDAAGTKTVTMQDVLYGTARAWVNFNGTGVIAIRDSYNVSSITDNATGDFTVNFTNAMQSASYVSTGSAITPGVVSGFLVSPAFVAPSTTAVRCFAINTSMAATDFTYNSNVIHGD